MCGEGCRLVTDLGLDRFDPVGLDELNAHAAALHRMDRKYLVSRADAATVLEQLIGSHRILRIGERLTTSYRSTYFDTDDLAACRHHLQRRRRRWKVRSRLYLEDQRCQLEVKTTSARGMTMKTISPTASTAYGRLDDGGAAFVDATLREQRLGPVGDLLHPTVEVTYERATLTDLGSGVRVTIDSGVESHGRAGRVWLDPDVLVIETKGHLRAGLADRALLDVGVRPRRFSKYVSAASVLHGELRDNDVRRMLGRQLHVALTEGASA